MCSTLPLQQKCIGIDSSMPIVLAAHTVNQVQMRGLLASLRSILLSAVLVWICTVRIRGRENHRVQRYPAGSHLSWNALDRADFPNNHADDDCARHRIMASEDMESAPKHCLRTASSPVL